jgi:2-polyprenyl-6-methoxyphenol hydroxylase-like FAD-dependent oxidoreductase
MTTRAVVIAGGGPTGLMLAGELALAGVDVVQDAVNLGWKLAQVVKGTSPDGLLDTYPGIVLAASGPPSPNPEVHR